MTRFFVLVLLIITLSFCAVCYGKSKEPVHLVLKNINFHPKKRAVDKNFDILDFSIYLPKSAKKKTTANRSTSIGTIELPPLGNQNNQGNSAPYFEALTGLVPQKYKAPYDAPIYGHITVAPTKKHRTHKLSSKYTTKPQTFNTLTIKQSNPDVVTRTAYILPTVPSLIKIPNNPNEGENTEIYYHSSVTSNFAPHYEAYTAPRPPVKPEVISTVIRNPNRPYYEALTTHDAIRHQHPAPYNPYRQNPTAEELIHASPTKELLLNNVVYHDDKYNDIEKRISEQNIGESYEVQEQPQESKKNFQKQLSTPQVPLYINVDDATKTSTIDRPERLDQITPQPLTAELSFVSPWINNTATKDEELKDARSRKKAANENPASKAITDEIRYFQDIFIAQNSPHTLEFGHILDSPNGAEERYENKDFKEQRHQGKVFIRPYANVQAPGTYNAGVRKGTRDHGIETHERALKDLGLFQKRVKWTDKHGGYGEHYWDLAHDKKFT